MRDGACWEKQLSLDRTLYLTKSVCRRLRWQSIYRRDRLWPAAGIAGRVVR